MYLSDSDRPRIPGSVLLTCGQLQIRLNMHGKRVECVNMVQEVMSKGDHAHILCSSSKFCTWFRTVVIAKEKVNVYDIGGYKKTIQLEFLQLEEKVLLYVRVPGTHTSDARHKRL